jgi:hypothetical protein
MTTKLKGIDRAAIKYLRSELTEVFKIFGEKYGLAVSVGRITFDEVSFKASIEAAITEKAGEPKMAVDFRNLCWKHGMKPEDLGRIFMSGEHSYEIVGLKPRNRKYPIIAKRRSDGKQFKFAPYSVKGRMI